MWWWVTRCLTDIEIPVSDVFPKDMSELLTMDAERVAALLAHYDIPADKSREENMNRFMRFCNIGYQVYKIPSVYRSRCLTPYLFLGCACGTHYGSYSINIRMLRTFMDNCILEVFLSISPPLYSAVVYSISCTSPSSYNVYHRCADALGVCVVQLASEHEILNCTRD